jgi:hypothetical protein
MSHNQGHRPQSISLLILLFALSACEAQHVDGWKRRGDGSAPGLADTSDCHAEARRQAEARYPPQRIRNRGGEMTFENPGLFPAEISFFEQCMRRKGFERADDAFKHGRYTAEAIERRRASPVASGAVALERKWRRPNTGIAIPGH